MSSPGWAELGADEILLQLKLNPGATSTFVDTHQWSPLRAGACIIAGGHESAQFRRVAFDVDPAVQCWRIERGQLPAEFSSARALRSQLYRNGLESGSIGDVVVGSHVALAAVPGTDIAGLFDGAVATAGWDEPEVVTERATVSALRLDAAVAALFRVSRSEAQTAVEYGFVFQNFEPVKKRTATIAAGDQLVFRTKGRIEVVTCDSTTKSGRIAVVFKRFPA